MIYFGVLVGIIIMLIMITMAVRKKSDKQTRIAAIIALAVMILTVIICLLVIFTDTTVVQDPSRLIVGEVPETKEAGGNTLILLILIAFLIGVFIIVAIMAKKEANKQLADFKAAKPISNW